MTQHQVLTEIETAEGQRTSSLVTTNESGGNDGVDVVFRSRLNFFADILVKFRIISRAFLSLYMVLIYTSCNWFMGLTDPNYAQSVFISAIIGAGAWWFQIYVSGTINTRDFDIPAMNTREMNPRYIRGGPTGGEDDMIMRGGRRPR